MRGARLRFENQGIVLWYGTSDAPAPDGTVETLPGDSAALSITVGVAPQDPSNAVQARYRINGGTPVTAAAAFLRADGLRQAQYFRVWLPHLQPGDHVEYTAVCHCVGRQAPAPEQAAGYLSSFRIAAHPPALSPGIPAPGPQSRSGTELASAAAAHTPQAARPANPAPSPGPLSAIVQPELLYAPTSQAVGDQHVSQRLSQKLREEVQRVTGPMSPDLESAVGSALARARWHDLGDQPVAGTAAALLATAATDPRLTSEAQQLRAKVAATRTPTVAEVLYLHAPLRDNPVLHDDVTRGLTIEFARLAGLRDQATQAVADHSAALLNNGPATLEELAAQGRLSHSDASALQAILELAKLTDSNLALIRALHGLGHTSPVSLAGWSRDQWQQLITAQRIPVPPGDTPASYADIIVHNFETTLPAHTVAAHGQDEHLATLVARNPHLDLRRVDLVAGHGDHLDWTGIPATARPVVEQQLRSYQRVVALADTSEDRLALKRGGHDSATSIASKTEDHFVRTSGLSEGQARLIYARAQDTALSVAHHYAAVRSAASDVFNDLAVGNLSPLVNELRQIDGLRDLFGQQDFCDCDDCHSVLSPAAYFADLMHFVESNVSRPTFIAPNKTNHPLYLKQRRPDLWTLPLTCENTHTMIPYLTIVNEVLEAWLRDLVGGDVYDELSDPGVKVSFCLPFTLPHTELSLYLGHFALTPADIYQSLQRPDAQVRRARLDLAPDDAKIIATPDPGQVACRLGSPATLAAYGLQDFLQATGLQRDEFDSVLALRFHPDLGAVTVTSEPDPGELQNFPQIIQNLTPGRVDFIHRFVRLWRATHWQIAELDLVLLAAREAGMIGIDIDSTVIELLGRLSELRAKLRLSVEELCALVGQLPVSAAFPRQPAPGDRRLYERVFDLANMFGPLAETTLIQTPGPELAQSFTFHHYSFNTLNQADTAVDPKTPLLVGSLGISETELLLIVALLKDEMPFDAAGDCALDRRRLSLLYRHTRVARALNLPIEDFIRALQLLFDPSGLALTSLDQIEDLIAFASWLKASPFSTADLRFILAGAETGAAKYANTPVTVAQLVQQVQSSPSPDRLDSLRSRLGAMFNLTGARLADTVTWTSADIASAGIQTALAITFTDGAPDKVADLDALVDLIHQLERSTILHAKLKLDDEAVSYLTRHPASFGIPDITTLTRRDVQSMLLYTSLAGTPDQRRWLHTVIDEYQATRSLSAEHRAALADLWRVDHSLIESLCTVTALPAPAVDALGLLRDRVKVCTVLGINAYSLAKLGDDSSLEALRAARDIAIGAVKAKYADDALRAQTLQPYEDQINTIKRDALCDYIIARQSDLHLRDHNEIYDLLLLDVDMSGCFRTSRVVAAISSVQLYVQRCLLNLEQSQTGADSTPDAAVDPMCIPAAEWEWRKNYRVWEANRKVFLYPESYLDPNLLDNKTPLLAELEDDLLQQKITKDSASAAYQRYLTQFAELAHLRVAGTYYRQETCTYYFFARTHQDPPVYYWRTWDGTTWSAWQKIELAIDAPAVAAEFHLGRLFLFWVDGKSQEKTTIQGGSSCPEYYEVTISLLYSALNASGKWLPPQKLDSLYPL